ncbi:FtsX-like permease family protein [Chengkuizengella axinellae]|uniref:ABC transporter permease n=1 Tax=Chengkuizengella axinellae TaxID=3064388 RepID=A0ABT9J377_9BACL|nr:ABC transporter permease [Chengkuizengella sp. 2205SS18-9]MDP5276018.1 ABC transporter permease [Chengkuizengella sp. 2205SS18-9]
MNVNQLIYRNLKKNIKNYFLYVFALIFSVALYFAFVTLQYDPSMDETSGSIKGAAAIRSASFLLFAMISIFLLYANTIFIKRRSKEIGLFQLIGMTKNKIFRILTAENFILYFGSVILGIFIGFSISKFILLVLFKITEVKRIATLHFSSEALIQTLIVFSLIYIFIMLMNYIFIKKHYILSLFHVISTTEAKVQKMSWLQMLIGVLGILLITTGYYISSKLFSGSFSTVNELFLTMIFILTSVIIGTYLFYKGSVSFISHLIRKKKNGYLSINEVLSLTSIMFRMKSNALLLTIITTVSALAISFLSLSYISYYSAEKNAQNNVAADFSIPNVQDAEIFKQKLTTNHIQYTEYQIDVIQVNINAEQIIETNLGELGIDPSLMSAPVISDLSIKNIDLAANETLLTGNDTLMFLSLKDAGSIQWIGQNDITPHEYIGFKNEYFISWYFTNGGPAAIVDELVFKQLKNDLNPEIQLPSFTHIGIHITEENDLEQANDIFKALGFNSNNAYDSRLEMMNDWKMNMGFLMFIVSFLGLTFLVTSGCILYFKQMGEGEDEKPNYTILRKLGYTQSDLLKGIRGKQIYNFGIPLIIGLLHSFFAVKSGWFFFGTELWTPMIIVMGIYTALYSIFGMLSVLYYKKVINDSL